MTRDPGTAADAYLSAGDVLLVPANVEVLNLERWEPETLKATTRFVVWVVLRDVGQYTIIRKDGHGHPYQLSTYGRMQSDLETTEVPNE